MSLATSVRDIRDFFIIFRWHSLYRDAKVRSFAFLCYCYWEKVILNIFDGNSIGQVRGLRFHMLPLRNQREPTQQCYWRYIFMHSSIIIKTRCVCTNVIQGANTGDHCVTITPVENYLLPPEALPSSGPVSTRSLIQILLWILDEITSLLL